ncbi:MAG: endonuclease V [Nanoarchaeota archaeon]
MDEAELIKKYNIDIEMLKKEQIKLAKSLTFKDSQDFSIVDKIGAVETAIMQNRIVSVIIVCDRDFNIIEQQYFADKLRFPYLNEFRSYRELPTLVEAFNKLTEKPQIIFVRGHGITHPRLGLASHFALAVNTPVIGVADNIFEIDKIEGENILKDGKIIGKVLQSKEKSNPLYISVGNGISLKSAYELTKGFIKQPHKLPEPLHLAHKYAKSVSDEIKV